MDFFEWRNECESNAYLHLEEFLDRHAGHEIIVIEEAIHQCPSDADELRQLCGGDALVEYVGKESPHYSDNDGLYFVLTPLTKRGKQRKNAEPVHVVVYPN